MGLPDGPGILMSPSGDIVYNGFWKANKYHGSGTLFKRNFMYRSGSFENGLAHGTLVEWNMSGQVVFKGTAILGMYHTGTLWQFDVEIYDFYTSCNQSASEIEIRLLSGCFVDNLPCGTVLKTSKFLSPNFTTEYSGEMQKGLEHGKGSIMLNYQSCLYEGDFSEGKFDGNGTLYRITFYWGRGSDCAIYDGEFKNGKKHGKGIVRDGGFIIYDGFFENDEMHGQGKLLLDDDCYVSGQFSNGKLPYGTIQDGTESYTGQMNEDFIPEGEGTFFYTDSYYAQPYSIFSKSWVKDRVNVGDEVNVSFSIDSDGMTGDVTGKVYSWHSDVDGYDLYLTDAVEKLGSSIVFKGSCRLLMDGEIGEGIDRMTGTQYVNGIQRLYTQFDEITETSTISELYDEKGKLALTPNDGVIMRSGNEYGSEWPTINGKMNVHAEDGDILYVANFVNSAMTNVLTCCNSIIVLSVPASEPPIDFISLETIPFGEVCYAFNSFESSQVVSRSTLDSMRNSHDVMTSHPLTRARIMRVFRLRFEQS